MFTLHVQLRTENTNAKEIMYSHQHEHAHYHDYVVHLFLERGAVHSHKVYKFLKSEYNSGVWLLSGFRIINMLYN